MFHEKAMRRGTLCSAIIIQRKHAGGQARRVADRLYSGHGSRHKYGSPPKLLTFLGHSIKNKKIDGIADRRFVWPL